MSKETSLLTLVSAKIQMILPESKIALVGVVVLSLISAQLLWNIVYNLFLSPLSHYPGPKLWAISRIPSQLSVVSGHTHLDITALHEKYGPVIRIGPNELAFNTPQAFRDIYNAPSGRACFPKDRAHYVPPPNGVDHIFSALDDDQHARHRKLLSPAFSSRSLKDQETLIMGHVDLLIQRLQEQVRSGIAKLDIKSWLNFTTFDITGDLMFGESFGCLSQNELHPWIELIFNSIKAISFMGAVNQFPWLNAVLTSMIPKGVLQKGLDHFNLGSHKVDRRLEQGTSRPDFISEMLKNGLSEKDGVYQEDARILSREELHSNAFMIIIAGSETSATLLSGAIFYLSKHPAKLQRVIQEIRRTFSSGDDITMNSSSNLPYVNAVIEESLRIYPPFVTSLARIPPGNGAFVDGNWVPKDTIVGCHHYASYHSASNFKSPNEFHPERWLPEGQAEYVTDQKEVLQPFSLGPRNCIGKQLAYAEIRLILCKLLFHFDIEMAKESYDWVDQKVYFLWDKPPLYVKLTEAHKTSEK